jgi:hypothetical protein
VPRSHSTNTRDHHGNVGPAAGRARLACRMVPNRESAINFLQLLFKPSDIGQSTLQKGRTNADRFAGGEGWMNRRSCPPNC